MTAVAGRPASLPPAPGAQSRAEGSERARLADIIYERSFGTGRITLSSGQESHFYFDMKPSMFHPEGASLIAKGLLAEIKNVNGEYVGGLEIGAVPITGAIAQLSEESGFPVHGFFVRKEQKQHGARKLVEGLPPGSTLSGKRVVVVDDVTTSGASALTAVRACRADGANVVLVISIVDREEGASGAFAAEGIPFKALFSASEFLSRTREH